MVFLKQQRSINIFEAQRYGIAEDQSEKASWHNRGSLIIDNELNREKLYTIAHAKWVHFWYLECVVLYYTWRSDSFVNFFSCITFGFSKNRPPWPIVVTYKTQQHNLRSVKKKKIADKCSSTKKNTGLILSIYIFLPPLMARRKNGVYFILQTTDRLSQMLEKPTNDYPLRKDMYRKERLYRLCRPYRQLQESIKAIVSYYPNASFTRGNLSLWKITAGNQCQLSFECAILRKK